LEEAVIRDRHIQTSTDPKRSGRGGTPLVTDPERSVMPSTIKEISD